MLFWAHSNNFILNITECFNVPFAQINFEIQNCEFICFAVGANNGKCNFIRQILECPKQHFDKEYRKAHRSASVN